MRALVVGTGRMGHAVSLELENRGHLVLGPLGREDVLASVPDDMVDVAFEFTVAASAPGRVEELLVRGIPVVSGTTGFDPEPLRALAREKGVAFLHTPNFSIGVAVLKQAAALVARLLEPFRDFEAGIVERHHSAKRDAPSGTAKGIAEAVSDACGRKPEIVSLRHGGQPGEHVVVFEGRDESVELVHRARSRALFASGAVTVGEWLLASGLRGPVSFEDFFQGGDS
jgi:4-hydroxy-tetrahydrodipicolinate reductase